jgi:surface antigen
VVCAALSSIGLDALNAAEERAALTAKGDAEVLSVAAADSESGDPDEAPTVSLASGGTNHAGLRYPDMTKTRKLPSLFLCLTTAAVLTTGCASYGNQSRRTGHDNSSQGGSSSNCGNTAAATAVGAIVGGIAGSQIGSGDTRTGATIAGAILGGLAGNALARNGCEDRNADAYYYNRTYYDAFEQPQYGSAYVWQNPYTGHSGRMTPTRRANAKRYGYAGDCHEFRQEVYVQGNTYSQDRVACRTSAGTWAIVGG